MAERQQKWCRGANLRERPFEFDPPPVHSRPAFVYRNSRWSLVLGRSAKSGGRIMPTTSDQRRTTTFMTDFLQSVRERVIIYDGAMGTNIHKRNPSLDDYWGKENCNEILVLSRPDIIRDIHADFFRVGCDVVETDTFNGMGIVLNEFGFQDRVAEINIAAAKLAKEVAAQFSTPDKPRFVAGSIGSSTKLPSLGHIT